MDDLIKRLSSYHILNYILTGVVFLFFLQNMFSFDLNLGKTIVEDCFIYYFIGIVLSRIGSLSIEKIALKVKFIEYSNYDDFINAEKKDPKINILIETNNFYRTNIAIFLVLFLIKTIFLLSSSSQIVEIENDISQLLFYISSIFLFIFFLLSYRKQTAYIVKRIESVLNK